jgi:dethiobiotin synthetase
MPMWLRSTRRAGFGPRGKLRNPYVLAPAIAPHIAAQEAGIALDIDAMVRAFRSLAERAQYIVVEGAGGFRVPLDERFDLGDLAQHLQLPVVLVVGMRLGCISHALLTAEAIERRGLTIAGWIANRIDPSMRRYRANVQTLQERIDAPMLADVPHIAATGARRARLDAILDVSALVSRHATRGLVMGLESVALSCVRVEPCDKVPTLSRRLRSSFLALLGTLR